MTDPLLIKAAATWSVAILKSELPMGDDVLRKGS